MYQRGARAAAATRGVVVEKGEGVEVSDAAFGHPLQTMPYETMTSVNELRYRDFEVRGTGPVRRWGYCGHAARSRPSPVGQVALRVRVASTDPLIWTHSQRDICGLTLP